MSTFNVESTFKAAQNLFKRGKMKALVFEYARNYSLYFVIFQKAKHALVSAYSLFFGADIVFYHANERT